MLSSQSLIPLRSGREIPVIGLGTWKLTEGTAEAVSNAIELGYRLIDTSGDYGTQPGVGAGIRMSGIDRNKLFVVTKIEETDIAYDAVVRNLDELGLEQADLILIHRPPEQGPGLELWRGLIRAQRDGLTRDIGVSNYSIEQISELVEATGESPAVNQIEWTPFGHSAEMLAFARQNAIVLQAYSPLTRGERWDDPRLKSIAERHGKSPPQILIRWNLQHGVVPIAKASSGKHQAGNIDVFDFVLSDDEMRILDAANEHYSSLGKLPYV